MQIHLEAAVQVLASNFIGLKQSVGRQVVKVQFSPVHFPFWPNPESNSL